MDEIIQRTKDYNSIGIKVIWVPVIKNIDITNTDGRQLFLGNNNEIITKEFRMKD